MNYCSYCGKPLAAPDAMFCASCGRPVAQVPVQPDSTAPNSPLSSPLNTVTNGAIGPQVSPSPYAPPPPVAPIYQSTASSPVVIVTASKKSPGIAVLLELLFSGAGAMYADQIGVGIAWLIGSIVAGIIATVVLSLLAQQAVQQRSYYNGYYYYSSPNYSSVYIGVAVVGILSIGWFILRAVLVSRYAAQANARITGIGASGALMGTGASISRLYSRGGLIGVTIVFIFLEVASILLGYIFLGRNIGWSVGLSLGLGYWLAMRRLQIIQPWRMFAEAVVIISIPIFLFNIAGAHFSDISYLLENDLSYLIVNLIGFPLAATLLGTSLALSIADWRRTRELLQSKHSYQETLATYGIVIGVYVLSIVSFAAFPFFSFSRVLAFALYSIIITVLASILTARRLNTLEAGMTPQPHDMMG